MLVAPAISRGCEIRVRQLPGMQTPGSCKASSLPSCAMLVGACLLVVLPCLLRWLKILAH